MYAPSLFKDQIIEAVAKLLPPKTNLQNVQSRVEVNKIGKLKTGYLDSS